MSQKPTLHVVLPVYNEEAELADSVNALVRHLGEQLTDFEWRVTVADNASTDRTLAIAEELASRNPSVGVVHLPKKGRGRAIKYVWSQQPADVVAYMDLDLSTDLKHFPPLVRSLLNGYDLAIGTRNLRASKVIGRSLMRTITSKGYIFLIRLMFPVHFSDAQCGFKAVTRRVVTELVPKVVDDGWFFDTELLILAEQAGFRIYQEPVTWTDNPGSTVRVWKTVKGDLEGLWRLYRR
jgi:glycosyltransferase involved in cell wall biosynthesis